MLSEKKSELALTGAIAPIPAALQQWLLSGLVCTPVAVHDPQGYRHMHMCISMRMHIIYIYTYIYIYIYLCV